MLRSGVFSKTIAYLGIVTHRLDLARGVFGPFLPAAGVLFMDGFAWLDEDSGINLAPRGLRSAGYL